MGEQRVLVAFANQAGSTAGIAGSIATVLRRAGLTVECRVASEVEDVTGYDAVILGSGMFVPRRASDGGGFLARHRAALAPKPLWLYCAGPIGRGRCPAGATDAETDECSVVAVGRSVGARGTAIFGPVGLPDDADPMERLAPVNQERVRTWAAEIATELRAPMAKAAARRSRPGRCNPIALAR
jgi:menaquinone-dependent protoporphyrinogen oxidase